MKKTNKQIHIHFVFLVLLYFGERKKLFVIISNSFGVQDRFANLYFFFFFFFIFWISISRGKRQGMQALPSAARQLVLEVVAGA